MNRLDEVIADVAYVLDSLIAYRNVLESGSCNECKHVRLCEFTPVPGQQTRYNCPYFKRSEREEDG